MALEDLLQRILRDPSPDDLWQIHPYLLAMPAPAAVPARELAGLFYSYLSCVRSKLSSKQHSALAAWLQVGALGAIALEDMIHLAGQDHLRVITNLFTAGLATSFEALSSFQQVKAWETEFASVHDEAVWKLYEILWQLSVETQPDLPVQQRLALIETLLAAVRDPNSNSLARVALIIRLFQVLLLVRLAPLFQPVPAEEKVR
ncbi:MAG: hypothetical protein HY866_03945 [Chloroflexi bacterium]|nr:hypothetical protein [Chloroflexota bacterium]